MTLNTALNDDNEVIRNPFSPKSIRYFTESNTDINIAGGAIRSSKTYTSNYRVAKCIAKEMPKGSRGVITGKTAGTATSNIVEPLRQILGYDKTRVIHQPYYALKYDPKEITLDIIGAKDEAAEERVRGKTYHMWAGDELPLHPKGFTMHLIGRCSGDPGYKFWTNNPVPPSHWYYKDYVKPIREGVKNGIYAHFTLDDNPSLTDRYKQSLKQNYSGVFYEWFIEGKYVACEGLCHPSFNRDKHIMPEGDIRKKMDLGYINEYYIGIDFGYEHPLAMVIIGKGKENEYFIIKEFRESKIVFDDNFIKNIFKPFIEPLTDRGIRCDAICDNARPELIDFLQGYSGELNVDFYSCVKYPQSVRDGIGLIDRLYNTHKLFVSDICTQVVEENEGYHWKTDKQGNITKEEPEKVFDDLMDSVRYPIQYFETGNSEVITI
jgi:PBSX family phage terminase large subunit